MKKYALFDFANTLADLVPNRIKVVQKYVKECSGLYVDDASIISAYHAIESSILYSSIEIKTPNKRRDFYRDYNARILNFLGLSHLSDPNELFEEFCRQNGHWVLKPNVVDILEKIRNHGWSIGIISNFDESLERIVCDELGMTNLIDNLHISQVEGIEKPNIKFFESFIERHNVDVENCFYVGDSYYLDFLPAASLGIRTWLLDEQGHYSHLPQAIRQLDDVLNFDFL